MATITVTSMLLDGMPESWRVWKVMLDGKEASSHDSEKDAIKEAKRVKKALGREADLRL